MGDQFAADAVAFGLSGRATSEAEYRAGALTAAAEELRLAVLTDPSADAALLALAADPVAWDAAALAGVPPDAGALLAPGELPEGPTATIDALAAGLSAATAGAPAVPAGARAAAAAALACTPFGDVPFDCSALTPLPDDTQPATVAVEVSSAAGPPTAAGRMATPDSDDPNEKTAPLGYGGQGMVSGREQIQYRIYFENVATAPAPAARVTIVDDLEPELALSSFRLTSIQFGATTIEIPPGRVSYQTRVDATAELGVFVDVSAGIDVVARQGIWVLQAIDPATGGPPNDGLTGLLPPEDGTGRGRGFLEFGTGSTESLVQTGTVVRNSARITFDTNETLTTNTVNNTLDMDPPASSILGATPSFGGNDVDLTWSGSDPVGGAGLASYDVYVSEDGGPAVPILLGTQALGTTFVGEFGRTYAFYTRAHDRTGNTEDAPAAPDAVVALPPDCNGNGVGDDADLSLGTSADCNENGVPDECDSASGTSVDCDGDGIPDECQHDCNGNGIGDECELASGDEQDCDGSGVPDSCEIAAGKLSDVNGNGVPDECECALSTYCTTSPNSAGSGARIGAVGFPSLAAGAFALTVSAGPPRQVGGFLYGTRRAQFAFGGGIRCVGGTLGWLGPRVTLDGRGDASLPVDFGAPPASGFGVGEAVFVQFWYRDPAQAGAEVNHSDALEFHVCP